MDGQLEQEGAEGILTLDGRCPHWCWPFNGCFPRGASPWVSFGELAGGCSGVLTLLQFHPSVPSCCMAGAGVGVAKWVPCWSHGAVTPGMWQGWGGRPEVFPSGRCHCVLLATEVGESMT